MSQVADRTEPAPPERRSFLKWVTFIAGGVAGVIATIPLAQYLVLGALRRKEVPRVLLGTVNQFPVNETRLVTFNNKLGQPWDGMAAHMGVYVRYLGKNDKQLDQFLIFAMNCAHLGCPVTWFPQSGLFMCPCHGGVYYENGEHASGPPPRGLFRMEYHVSRGRLYIQAPFLPTLQNTLEKPANV